MLLKLGKRSEPTQAGREQAAASSAVFWRYWTASTVSGVGGAVRTVALPLTAVTVLQASSFQVSLLTAANYAAWIVLGLPAGVIVGRLPLRGTQIAMDLVRAAALLTVPAAAWTGLLTFTQLVIVALVTGLASVIFDVGNLTFLPSIVNRDQLTARNSLTTATHSATQLGGPSLGGVLVQTVGAATSLLADVTSFLASAALLRSLPRPPRHAPARPATSVTGLIRDGLRFVRHHPVIRPCVLDAALINFVCGGLMALTPVFLVRTLHAPAGIVGLVMAADGLGGLIGATLTPRFIRKAGSARAALAAGFAGAIFALLMPVGRGVWGLAAFAAGSAGFAIGVVVVSIATRTHRMTVTPPDLLPRVLATVRFISWGMVPLGALTAGALASGLGNRGSLWIFCGLAFTGPASLLAGPVRSLRDLTDEVAPAHTRRTLGT